MSEADSVDVDEDTISHVPPMDRTERSFWASQMRKRREELGFTRDFVASQAGVAPRQIAATELGESIPQEGTLRKIMAVLRLGEAEIDAKVDPHVAIFRSLLIRIPDNRKARFMGQVMELAIRAADAEGPDPDIGDKSM